MISRFKMHKGKKDNTITSTPRLDFKKNVRESVIVLPDESM